MRAGLVTSSSVPSTGIRRRVAPRSLELVGDRGARRCDGAAAKQPDGCLLIARRVTERSRNPHRAGDQPLNRTAIKAAHAPRGFMNVLEVRGLLKRLVVIDAERSFRLRFRKQPRPSGAGRRSHWYEPSP
jgi:hypothetical protein